MTTNTFARSDTLLGICEALGEDLGFNPLLLRIALTAGMLWNPLAMIGGYLMAGVMILIVRRLTPVRVAAAPDPIPTPLPLAENDPEVLPLAA